MKCRISDTFNAIMQGEVSSLRFSQDQLLLVRQPSLGTESLPEIDTGSVLVKIRANGTFSAIDGPTTAFSCSSTYPAHSKESATPYRTFESIPENKPLHAPDACLLLEPLRISHDAFL
jgi:hypothetical protein